MYNFTEKNKVVRMGGIIMNYLFKTELVIKSIKQIDEKYMKIKINYHDDMFIFFGIVRIAKSLKRIKRIFYFILKENEDKN